MIFFSFLKLLFQYFKELTFFATPIMNKSSAVLNLMQEYGIFSSCAVLQVSVLLAFEREGERERERESNKIHT